MESVYGCCCGVDVHKKVIVACLRNGASEELREYGTTTGELLKLADWLAENRCEMTAMESTASYWKPLYNVMEAQGQGVMVVNAQRMKAVPGRKTDAKDAQWIADLLQHGLLKASYIPDRGQRELRELVGYRKSLVQEKNREVNRFQKMLEGGNIKLSGTASDINGKSSGNILNEILSGKEIDAGKLEGLVDGRLKASRGQILEDIRGTLSPVQRKLMKEALKRIDELERHIKALDDDIDSSMGEKYGKSIEKVDEIPGVGKRSAEVILAVTGQDMGRFAADKHLCSWAGICPGNNESAQKRKSGRTTKGNKLLKTTLINCAHAAVKVKNSYFSAQFARISAHRGKKRAYVAVAHSILIAVYHILKDGVGYKELGADYYNRFNKERKINGYLKKLKKLGWEPGKTAQTATV